MAGNKRPSIPEKVKLQVWTEAAGRCQFRGHNIPLWYNELTLNKRNFGEMAHIIGASKKGPRGDAQSAKLAKDPNNIMLVCDRCHKEIDDTILKELYSVEELRKMKKEHADRVRFLLSQPSKKTRPFIFTSQIGGQSLMFGDRSIQNAILPDYPDGISDDWYRLEIGTFDRTKQEEWIVAQSKIDQEIESINRAVNNSAISHLSVFGFAPQPLLMWMGRQLGDKIVAQIYEPMRVEDIDKKWKWDKEDGSGTSYNTTLIKKGKGTDVILLLALSDYLREDKYFNMLNEKPHIYQLSIDNPVQGFLKKKSEKAAFIQACRALLNQIQNEVGNSSTIHVFPAMPTSLAVEFGRLLQPTKDPSIWVYENINGDKPEKVLELL